MGWALSGSLPRIDHFSLRTGAAWLAATDPRLAGLLSKQGLPPVWVRTEGFATLVKIILEQQVSLASAAAAYTNLTRTIGLVEPVAFLTLDDATLKRVGFSRQKAGYCRGVAEAVVDGSLDLAALRAMEDDRVRSRLTALRGVGPWTADVYLLFALRRADAWPTGDRALVVAMAESLPLDEVPSYETAFEMARAWSPWRSIAARMLWHAYLTRRGRSLA
jgi:DNA-3-methyladenine glycosylase II